MGFKIIAEKVNVHSEESVKSHTATIKIYTRDNVRIQLDAEINLDKGISRYIKRFELGRGINSASSFTMELASILPEDKKLKSAVLSTSNEAAITWKTILKVGTKIEVTVNKEFKGIYFVSGVKKTSSHNKRSYIVSCIGMLEWILRQQLFFDFGNEQTENFQIFNERLRVDFNKGSNSIQGAIQVIIEQYLFNALQSGDFTFIDGKSINDSLGFAFSRDSYLGRNLIFMQTISPVTDYNIWENIMKYQSPPFHEIWITNGGRSISLSDDEDLKLKEGKEYIVFRPVPYDDEVLFKQPVPSSINAIMVGDETLLRLHHVQNNFRHKITDFHVKDTDLENNDADAYSFYSVLLSGYGLDANSSDKMFPPLVDKVAFNFLGKKVFSARLDSIDMADKIKEDQVIDGFVKLAKSLQLKTYHWFKNNSEFNKGNMRTIWLDGIAEGEHLEYESRDKEPDESGIYYINRYNLSYNIENATVEYNLSVTRGMPSDGFTELPFNPQTGARSLVL